MLNWQDTCCRWNNATAAQVWCADLVQWIARMKHRTVHALQIRQLIADIRRVVDILNVDISEEESQTGVYDPALPGEDMSRASADLSLASRSSGDVIVQGCIEGPASARRSSIIPSSRHFPAKRKLVARTGHG
jgi:hypothetical protein